MRSKKKNHESQLFFVWVKRDNSYLPWPKVIGIHGSSFRDLIPSLIIRRRRRVREVTKFRVAIGNKATLWSLSRVATVQSVGSLKSEKIEFPSKGFINLASKLCRQFQ